MQMTRNGIASPSARRALACSATLAVASFASTASGALSLAGSNGLEGLGSFTGSMTWTYLGSGAGTLAVSLTNTSPAANGGYLTGFAFNTASGVGMTLATAPNGSWIGMTNVSASPFPDFDFGAALDGNWEGGGSPNAGIGVGSTGAFTFDVSGDDTLLASLSDASFFDTSNGYGFAARFRGFADGGSDKVPGEIAVVPLPQTLGLAAASIAGLALFRRRK
ncbi:MAG: hypothetical protein LW806_07490 [Planctomycetaceae bacterium]|jgi:hypothetical protein|nr:hypothetical protein [Planctomycetaceae bacterium]